MKIINVNAWGGTLYEELMTFIKIQSETTDIFCFQEIYKSPKETKTPSGFQSNILTKIADLLPDFNYHFSPQFHGRDFHHPVDYPVSQGLATFWKKSLKAIGKGERFIYGRENEITQLPGRIDVIPPRNLQFVEFDNFIVLNLHGYWAPSPKYDTPQRIKQSEIILDFLKKYEKPRIVVGDFNLSIDTRAVLMFEDAGFKNLVLESGASTTRSSHYDIKWREFDKFADYIFTSKDLEIKDFRVLQDEVSDHLPLLLEFEV